MTVGKGARIGVRSQIGQGLVEFSLALPVILLAFLVTIDVGRFVLSDNTVTNAAREGMRTAIVNQNVADIRAAAAGQATGLGISTAAPTGCFGTFLADASQPSGVCIKFVDQATLTVACNPVYVGCVVVVQVKYTYVPLTPVVGNWVAGVFYQFGYRATNSTSQQPIESVCASPSTCPTP